MRLVKKKSRLITYNTSGDSYLFKNLIRKPRKSNDQRFFNEYL